MADISQVINVAEASISKVSGRTVADGDSVMNILFPSSTSYISSIQKVSITISSGNTTGTATITSVDTSLSFLTWGGFNAASTATDVDDTIPYIELTNATTITATIAATGSHDVVIECCVIEGTSDLISSIQTGTITLGTSVANNTATVTSVNTSYSSVSYLGNISDRPGLYYATDFAVVGLTNSTTVTASRGLASGTYVNTVSFQLIEFNSSAIDSIQQETINLTGTNTSDTHSITSVSMSNSLVIYRGNTSSTNTYTASATRGELTASDTITLTRGASSSITRYMRLTVVEFVSAVMNSVQRDTIDLTGSGGTQDDTITSVDTNNTAVQQVGMMNTSGADWGDIFNSCSLNSATVVRATRGDTSTTNDAGCAHEAWEFN
jgi:hypothetical protein